MSTETQQKRKPHVMPKSPPSGVVVSGRTLCTAAVTVDGTAFSYCYDDEVGRAELNCGGHPLAESWIGCSGGPEESTIVQVQTSVSAAWAAEAVACMYQTDRHSGSRAVLRRWHRLLTAEVR